MEDLVEPSKLLPMGTTEAQAGSGKDAHPGSTRQTAGQPSDNIGVLPDGEGHKDEAVSSADDHIQLSADKS
jgi:hypothetical protein